MPKRVIIVIEGGVLQSVYSWCPSVEIELIDLDDAKEGHCRRSSDTVGDDPLKVAEARISDLEKVGFAQVF